MALSKILVVIDPTLDVQPAFERGLDSADITGAGLHLYCCVNEQYGEGGKDAITAAHRSLLEGFAGRARERKVDAEWEVDWNDDWRGQVVIAGKPQYIDLTYPTVSSLNAGSMPTAAYSDSILPKTSSITMAASIWLSQNPCRV